MGEELLPTHPNAWREPRELKPCVRDDDARRRITEEAYRFVTTELTLDRSFSRLLELAREATLRAA